MSDVTLQVSVVLPADAELMPSPAAHTASPKVNSPTKSSTYCFN